MPAKPAPHQTQKALLTGLLCQGVWPWDPPSCAHLVSLALAMGAVEEPCRDPVSGPRVGGTLGHERGSGQPLRLLVGHDTVLGPGGVSGSSLHAYNGKRHLGGSGVPSCCQLGVCPLSGHRWGMCWGQHLYLLPAQALLLVEPSELCPHVLAQLGWWGSHPLFGQCSSPASGTTQLEEKVRWGAYA